MTNQQNKTVNDLELRRHAKAMLELYPASDRSYCTYDPSRMLPADEKGKIVPADGYKTVRDKPVTIELWEQHLLGQQALVIALACRDGTTKVTVVDADIYGVDVAGLAQTAKARELPIYVRRTKSSGAHLTVFHDQPISIAESVKVAEGIARMFGLVNSKKETQYEVFPPLQKPEPLPKALNMPFMGGEGCFIKKTGAEMLLSEFLFEPKYLTAEQRADIIKTKKQKKARATSDDQGRKYAEGKLRRYANELGNAPKGVRNIPLNHHAFHMGTMVAREWITRDDVEETFKAAIEHWEDKDHHLETMKRAISDGEKHPHADLTDEELITEDNAALEFAERHAGDLRYDHDVGSWYQWTGTHWHRDKTALAFSEARNLVRELARDQSQRVRNITSKASFAGNVERYAQSDRALVATQERWDRDPFLLGTPGGTVDLRTGELREARPEDGITKITAVAPAETADCPLWIKFLNEATAEDNDLIEFLQMLCGYAMTGDISEELLVFIYGPGGNGKTVFMNTFGGVLGDYHTAAPMGTFTETNTDRHPTDLAGLRGARLVTSAETDEGRSWAETRVKQVTGGDPISARFMRQDFFTYQPAYQLFIIGNHKPKLRNITDAMRRRLAMIPFYNKPKQVDKKLEAKLQAEWPGVLRWMIDGCLMWQAKGITLPEIVVATTEEYFDEQDLFGQWTEEWLERTNNPGDTVLSKKLFASWSYFAQLAAENPRNLPWFNDQMRRKQFVKGKRDGKMIFRGIKFKKPPEDAEELAERAGWFFDERASNM